MDKIPGGSLICSSQYLSCQTVSGQLESFGIDGLDGCKLACWYECQPKMGSPALLVKGIRLA
jgi:hypothetical protein